MKILTQVSNTNEADETMTESHLFDPKHISALEREDRKSWQNPEEILGKVEIRPDFIAADKGVGVGSSQCPLPRKWKKSMESMCSKRCWNVFKQKLRNFS